MAYGLFNYFNNIKIDEFFESVIAETAAIIGIEQEGLADTE